MSLKKIKNISFDNRSKFLLNIRMERHGDDLLIIVDELTAQLITPEQAKAMEDEAERASPGATSTH